MRFMQDTIFTIIENKKIAKDVYRMLLRGDTSAIKNAGEFVNIQLDGFYLRRPISVCDVEGDVLTLIYKVVGKGTEVMSKMSEGIELQVMTGLGNGYDLSLSGDHPLLVGGGVGVPPMYLLAKRLLAQGKKVPLLKTRETWQTDLDKLMAKNKAGLGGTQENEEGLTYEMYLRLLFILGNTEAQRARIQLLIEKNMQKSGWQSFTLYDAVTEFRLKTSIMGRGGEYESQGVFAYD